MSAPAIDLAHLRGWVDREQAGEQVIDPFPARALAGVLDRPQAPVIGFSFRALRPAFDGAPLAVCGTPTPDGAELWTRDEAGFTGMKATAGLA